MPISACVKAGGIRHSLKESGRVKVLVLVVELTLVKLGVVGP